MPLPSPKVLNAIIQLYVNHRDKERKAVSVTDRVLNGATDLGKWMAGQPRDKQIITFCTDVKKQFRPKDPDIANDPDKEIPFEEWIQVVAYLGNKAHEAQQQKLALFESIGLAEKESLLCETLHALRNYIVLKLKEDHQQAFEITIISMVQKEEALRQKIAQDRFIYTDVSNSVTEHKSILLHLAFLEHIPSLSDAVDRGLFSYLKQRENKPENMPYCLQKNFCRVLYEDIFRRDTLFSFEEFEKRALDSDKISHAATPKNPSVASKISLFNQAIVQDSPSHSSEDESNQETKKKKPAKKRTNH